MSNHPETLSLLLHGDKQCHNCMTKKKKGINVIFLMVIIIETAVSYRQTGQVFYVFHYNQETVAVSYYHQRHLTYS